MRDAGRALKPLWKWGVALAVLVVAIVVIGMIVQPRPTQVQQGEVFDDTADVDRNVVTQTVSTVAGIYDGTVMRYPSVGDVTAWSVDSGTGYRCLVLLGPAAGYVSEYDSPEVVDVSCGDDSFQPTITVQQQVIDSSTMRDSEFEVTRFVLNGDEVEVWQYAPSAAPTPGYR